MEIKAATPDEFLDFVDQAIFENDEMLESMEFDEINDYEPFIPVYEQLAHALRQLLDEVKAGKHEFGDGSNLPFMELVERNKRMIPYADLLEAINRLHRQGLG